MSVKPRYLKSRPEQLCKSEWKALEKPAQFDKRWGGTIKLSFGHALSDYQSQGSEWDHVAMSFYNFKPKGLFPSPNDIALMREKNFRSGYTMANRTKKKLDILIA